MKPRGTLLFFSMPAKIRPEKKLHRKKIIKSRSEQNKNNNLIE